MSDQSESQRPLGETRAAVLVFLRDHLDRHGYPPTIREIGRATKISSTSVVNYHLNQLARAGLIVRHFGVSRGIYLVDTVPIRIGGEIEAETLDGVPLGRVRFVAPVVRAA